MQQVQAEPRILDETDGIPVPPNADDLPDSDGMPMDSERQVHQMNLLAYPLRLHWRDRDDVYIGTNMFVYFSAQRRYTEDFRGPDVFVATGVRPGERRKWVVWLENKAPDVVIEILSESTRDSDKTEKFQVYQDYLRVPVYVWYDPFTGERAGWRLVDGRYQLIEADDGPLPVGVLGLTLVRWQGAYQGVEAPWLRWATAEGEPLPTAEELAAEQQRRADEEARRAEDERRRADEEARRSAALLAEIERYRRRFGPLTRGPEPALEGAERDQ